MRGVVTCLAALFLMLLIAVPSFPQATTYTDVFDFPFNLSLSVPCANDGEGELIQGSGTVHAVVSTTVNKNHVHVHSTFNPQGVTAVGQSTGTVYLATGATELDTKGSVVDFPFVSTFVNRFMMISQGSGGNLKVSETAHFTVDADGRTAVFLDNLVITCQ
ncbi:MAG: hypothetical protein LAO04_19755 [Acidobacteriia bacterium]|nr:hypothetical protein [Terriglobia bacterium]